MALSGFASFAGAGLISRARALPWRWRARAQAARELGYAQGIREARRAGGRARGDDVIEDTESRYGAGDVAGARARVVAQVIAHVIDRAELAGVPGGGVGSLPAD
jgi:hypothetical protein